MARQDSPQQSLPIDMPTFSNQDLFAERYLEGKDRLLALPEWQEPDGLSEVFEALRELYEDSAISFNAATNEAQTEEAWIRPVLRTIGWEFIVQQPIAEVNRRPDYALFASGDEKQAAEELKESPQLWDHAAAVADAKRWQLDLDSRRAGETPSAQISNYLYRSGVRWGILTNGRKWRLYEQDRARTGDTYYEVDLVDLLNSENLVAFRYFYLFFRRDGFVPIRDDKSFVDLVFEGSERYRTDVGEDLKDAVYDALRWLMNGFFAYPDNDLDASRPGDLQDVHDLSLIVLYRLLFLLYAEDRDLLPVREQPYKDYSLLRLQREINTRLREGQPQATNASGIWSRFLDTCALIDNGLHNGDEWIIPAYNGGLFSPERYPEIAHEPCGDTRRWRIGDHYLARAIDLVAYQRERWDRPGADDVDYATLDVQHLGSIYEGLLELQPRVAEEPMIEQPGKSGKPPTVEPEAEIDEPKKVRGAPPRRFEPGEIYLITDRGERKATGSYYTPKYIVDYIVEHTVGELAAEAADEVEKRWEAASDEHNWEEPDDLHAAIAEISGTIDDLKTQHEEAAGDVQLREEMGQKLKGAQEEKGGLEGIRRSLLEPYLDLKILDPAMGSGHFLVGAADYLSMAMATDPNLPPHPNEGTKPQVHYKQLVVQHCLYGVDLNPLAVELAKLSLWLHTVSQDKALSFLDHHLRCGNSLIGARIEEDLTKPPPAVGGGEQNAEGDGPQLSFRLDATLEQRDLSAFLDSFRRIAEAPIGDADTERQKDAWYREMDENRDPYRQVANLWLAPYFGVEVTPKQYAQALEALRAGIGSEKWQDVCGEEWFEEAQRVAREQRFFHWELEFPEAFFEASDGKARWKAEGERGFDAVIGNPPWGVDLQAAADRDTCDLQDSSEVFYVEALHLSCREASVCLLLPSTVLSIESASFRRILLEDHLPGQVVNLGPDWFTHAIRMGTVVWISMARVRPDEGHEFLVGVLPAGVRRGTQAGETGLRDAVRANCAFAETAEALSTPQVLVPMRTRGARDIIEAIRERSLELGAVTTSHRGVELNKAGHVARCPHCGLWGTPPRRAGEEATAAKKCDHCGREFALGPDIEKLTIVRDEPLAQGDWKPYVDGDAIQRYVPLSHRYIDVSRQGVIYKDAAMYAAPKILIREAGVGVSAALDLYGVYCPRSVYVYRLAPGAEQQGYSAAAVTAVLLSRLMLFFVYNELGETDSSQAFAKLRQKHVRRLPIPTVETPEDRRLMKRLEDTATQLAEKGICGHRAEDWELEALVSRVWGIGRAQISSVISYFAGVHDNKRVRDVFPGGIAGREELYEREWIDALERLQAELG